MTEESPLQPLPWFAFNIKEYLADTSRLTTEGHGAYLLLVLELYQKAEPIPDDDDVLAAITRLPVDAWKRQRKFLERFFVIGRDAHRSNGWWHSRVERELRTGTHLVNLRLEASAKGVAARRSKVDQPVDQPDDAARPQRSTARITKRSERSSGNRAVTQPVNAPVTEKQTDGTTHLHKHYTSPSGGGESPPPKVETGLQGSEEPSASTINLRLTEIDADWKPSEANIATAHDYGLTDAEIDDQARAFVTSALDRGLTSRNWNASWENWCRRQRDWKAKNAPPAAPPRVEVNHEIDWERAVRNWKAGNVALWGRHLGPEPGQIGCKCPVDVLERAGIDPKTGLRKAS